MRAADERRNASIMISSSIRCSSTGAHVGWTMKTSVPRMFSSIWNDTSVSGNRLQPRLPERDAQVLGNLAAPAPGARCRRTPSVRRSPPSCPHPRALACRTSSRGSSAPTVGWGGRIRTFEYGIQSPAPYHLATPHPDLARARRRRDSRRPAPALDASPGRRRTATACLPRDAAEQENRRPRRGPTTAAQTVSVYESGWSRQGARSRPGSPASAAGLAGASPCA